ncbi:SusC/RagA family TonB-linked outer membrane protein [Flavivirga spongiicola]|uniref:SusC/RagA family TonB-linked outer membrane protein n=1 Tax=Flavivirga spongiicola TaxID=421621 RepID=A0ABU7XRH6_9FLAO|nr:SusC/RagA family TonB-linked outer membrane protein [Flavivirga sp. MEBiC05379]MDO5977432.1 SusC/RagA family TonB-linked outer membrane protein [Flavivirga sp. MEBiC05379]
MKLSIYLFIITLFQVQANTYSQNTKITLDLENVTIENVLRKIESLTEFKILYNDKEVDYKRRIDAKFNKQKISKILKDIFSNTPIVFDVFEKQIILKHSLEKEVLQPPIVNTTKLLLQQNTVSGNVKDQFGSPLPGVNIIQAGTTNGTQTDFDGNYSISIEKGAVLQFSYIGMISQNITVGDGTTINVVLLESQEALDEIVVTALGIKREKKALGYSVTELKGDEFNDNKDSNVLNSFQGKVAGVQINTTSNGIGSSSRVVIRGNSSFTGNNQPLYVVDGIPIRSSSSTVSFSDEFGSNGSDAGNDHAANINPEDIASVSVLKGPSAAALYGSRAANGVIVITTKKGSSERGLGITINSNTTFEDAYVFPRFQNEFGGGRVGEISGKVWNLDPALAYVDNNGIEIQRLDDDKNWGARLNGQTYRQWDSQYTLGTYSPNPNFAKNFYNTGVNITNSIAIDGGNETTQVRASFTNVDEQGIVPESTQKRNTVTLRLSSKIADKLTLDGRITYVNQKVHNRTTAGGLSSIPWVINHSQRNLTNEFLADFLNPEYNPTTWPPANISAFVLGVERRDPLNPFRQGLFESLGPKTPWNGNPYWLVKNYTNDDERHNYTGFVSLKYDIMDGLSAMARIGLDQSALFSNRKNRAGSRIDFLGSYSESTRFNSDLNADFLLAYNKNISDDVSVALNVGGNHFKTTSRSTSASGSQFIIPDFFAINNFKEISDGNLSRSRLDVNSLYFSGQIGYKNYAFLDVTGRNDWSSSLPAANRSFFYPSVAGSLVFSEALQLNKDVLSFGKLRASWAEVGNGTDPYRLVSGVSDNRFGSLLTLGLDGTIPLANLKPEITTSIEFGTDLRFFKNRLGLDFTWYKSNTVNQIVSVGVPSSTGFGSRIVNAGDIENKGFEVLLTGTPIETKDFSWDASINFTKNTSEVIDVLSEENVSFVNVGSVTLSGDNGLSFRAEKGMPYGVIYGRKFLRNSDGLVVVDNKGNPLGTDQVLIGDPNPEWLAGISNSFKYKNFRLSFLIDVRKGGIIINNTARTMSRAGTNTLSLEGRDAFYNSPEFLALSTGSARSSLPGSFTGGVSTWVNNNAVVQDGNLPTDANGNQIGGEINTFYGSPRIYQENLFKSGIVEPFVEDASFVKLREVSLSYTLPKKTLDKLPFSNVSFSLIGRNLFILHRNTKDFDPESNVSSGNGQGIEGNALPGTRRYGFNIKLEL